MTYQIAKQTNVSTQFVSYSLFNVFASGKVEIGSYATLACAKRTAKSLLLTGDTLEMGKAESYSIY